MEAIDFVLGVRETVIDSGINDYVTVFTTQEADKATNAFWKEALPWFQRLSESDKEIFFKILRVVQIDTAATILALLDGTFMLEKQEELFVLLEEGKEEPINGELRDLFLSFEDE